MKCLVNISDKFGRLTVVGKERPEGSKRTIWICKCDCGNLKKTDSLRKNGKGTMSCGCLFKETHGRELINIEGMTFGRSTVVGKAGKNKQNRWIWECKCVCGNTHFALATSLKRMLVKSCGCQRSEKAKEKCGEKHYNWKGGLTSERFKIRNSQESVLWRKEVFIRDNFTCQICNKIGSNLNAHHLESFHCNEDLRFNADNGITLCYNCHVDFHSKYGKINNTKIQFEEYKNQRIHA